MTQESTVPKTPAKEPLLPDGVGITLEQAKALIAQNSGIVLANDEPALMGITICNAYLGELQKLHERHGKGLAKLMADKTDGYVKGVKAATDALAENLSSASAEGLKEVFRRQDARLAAFKNSLVWLAAIVSVSALLNVVVFVLRGLR